MMTMIRMLWSVVKCMTLACLLVGARAEAQYIFADSNGDALSTPDDRVRLDKTTVVDIYLVTDRNREGSIVTAGAEPLSVFSYEFVLAAVGGTVKWGPYTNAQPTMDVSFGRWESETEIYVGYGGPQRLAPGKYKLGTLSLEATSGRPRLEFRSSSSVHRWGGTTFGSRNPGKDGDHTLKFTEDRARLHAASDGYPRDWADADGVRAPDPGAEEAAAVAGGLARRFEVVASPNPSRALTFRLTVSTTQPGRLVVRLFDVQGRMVRTLRSEPNAVAGTYSLGLSDSHQGGLAAGIYLYRVETADGTRTGRVVLVD